jgi:hypothetical protein
MRNAIGLAVTAILMVGFIVSRPAPEVHTERECIPIGEAAEDYQYEVVGDWIIRE